MAKKIYIGVNNIARKVASAYIGVSNVARKIKKAYLGVNNVAKLIYESHKEDEELAPFTISKQGDDAWVVPSDAVSIDIFCVGGGGGAGGCMCYEEGWMSDPNGYHGYVVYGSSGGSGYTSTTMGVSVTPGERLDIVIGAGGAGGKSYSNISGYSSDQGVSSMSGITDGSAGGTTGVYRNGTALATAAGGNGGLKAAYTGVKTNKLLSYINYTNGANGGCGSGVAGAQSEETFVGSTTYWGYFEHSNQTSPTSPPSNQWGTNGNGSSAEYTSGGKVDLWRDIDWITGEGNRAASNQGTAGTGQGSNTRKYGLSGGTVYSVVAGSQTAGTGNSGALGKTSESSKAGSSGVVIITVHYS